MAGIIDSVAGLINQIVQFAIDYWPVAVFGVLIICLFILYKMVIG